MRGATVQRGKKWSAVLYLGLDSQTGKKRRKWISGFDTRREAEAFLLSVATSPAYGSGLGPHGSMRQRTGPHMAAWIEKADCGEQERASRFSRFHVHIEPRLAHVPLARNAPATIEGLMDGLDGLNPTSKLKVYGDLRAFFDYCLRMGWITANPCDGVKKPERRRYRPPVASWSRDHLRIFLQACEGSGDAGLLFLTAYFCAARQGEVLGLQGPQVDFDEHEPTVTFIQDLARRQGGGAEFDDTKTPTSDRTVLIPSWLAHSLRGLRKRQMEARLQRGPCEQGHGCRYQHCKKWHEWGLVFCQENGKPLVGRDVTQRLLKRFCQQAGVPPIRFHDLKHLHNTVCMRGNVNAGIIKSRAGHSSAAFSLDRYAWASMDRREQQVAVAALDLPFGRG